MQYTPKGFEAILRRFRGEIRGVCGFAVALGRNFSIPHKENGEKRIGVYVYQISDISFSGERVQ